MWATDVEVAWKRDGDGTWSVGFHVWSVDGCRSRCEIMERRRRAAATGPKKRQDKTNC